MNVQIKTQTTHTATLSIEDLIDMARQRLADQLLCGIEQIKVTRLERGYSDEFSGLCLQYTEADGEASE